MNPVGISKSEARFERGGHLELVAIDDLAKAEQNRPAYLEFLAKRGEGAEGVILHIPSAEATVRFLRSREFEIPDPQPNPVRRVVTFGGVVPRAVGDETSFL